MKTYDSKCNLKIFKLIGIDPMHNNTETKRTTMMTGIEQSITDILSESWKGKRIYTVNLRRKGYQKKSDSARSIFSSSNAVSAVNAASQTQLGGGPESVFVEIDLLTHTFQGQSSHILIVHNVSKYLEMLTNETKSYLELSWLEMLANKIMSPTNQILQATA